MTLKSGALTVFVLWCVFLPGCSEREEPTVAPGSTLTADDALRKAEAELAAAGISFSLDEPGALMNPEDLIPAPVDLEDAEKQLNFEEAIAQLNIALAEIEGRDEAGVIGSVSDRALIHFHLGFMYCFDAVSRLLLSDNPQETFVIEHNPNDLDNPWYNFDISPDTQAELNATEDPLEYPLAFTFEERQAIIDAADLLDDAALKPKEPNIQPQFSSVDRQPYTGSAIWHFQKAASLFGQYESEVMDALNTFNEELEGMRALLQAHAEEWGFIYTPPVR